MKACRFCGHANELGVRSCVACGYVFATSGPPDETSPPTLVPPVGAEAREASSESPVVASDETTGAGARWVGGITDAAARAARQSVAMAIVSAAAATVVAALVVLDAREALDVLGPSATILFGAAAPEIVGRTDLVSLFEHALVAGVLVMFAGWTQHAMRLVGHADDRVVLRTWLVPGFNAVRPGHLVTTLSRGREPRVGGSLVKLWQITFATAIVARLGLILWGYGFSPTPSTDAAAVTQAIVAVGARLVWIDAMLLSALVIRRLTHAITDEVAGRAT